MENHIMTAEDAISMFRRVYPDNSVHIQSVSQKDDNLFFVHAVFPDGSFWFLVTKNTVSPSYKSYAAIKDAIT